MATGSLPVKSEERKKLPIGPAVELYKMHIEHPVSKEIPTDGLHDEIPGLGRTPINYESIGAAGYPALRWLPDMPEKEGKGVSGTG